MLTWQELVLMRNRLTDPEFRDAVRREIRILLDLKSELPLDDQGEVDDNLDALRCILDRL